MKELQDSDPKSSELYIHKVVDFSLEFQEDDIDATGREDQNLCMVICMTKDGSRQLLQTRNVQIDIGFKRVMGFYKLELASMDRNANTSA